MQSFQAVISKILKGAEDMVSGTLTAYSFITVKYHVLDKYTFLMGLIMKCSCMCVDLQCSQVPGLCKVKVFCVALYKISAELP